MTEMKSLYILLGLVIATSVISPSMVHAQLVPIPPYHLPDPETAITITNNDTVTADPYQRLSNTTTATAPTIITPSPDPAMQQINQIISGCEATIQRMYPNAQTSADVLLKPPQSTSVSGKVADFNQMHQCNLLLNQAVNQYCNMLATYNPTQCAYMQTPQITNLIDMTAVIAQQAFMYTLDVPGGALHY